MGENALSCREKSKIWKFDLEPGPHCLAIGLGLVNVMLSWPFAWPPPTPPSSPAPLMSLLGLLHVFNRLCLQKVLILFSDMMTLNMPTSQDYARIALPIMHHSLGGGGKGIGFFKGEGRGRGTWRVGRVRGTCGNSYSRRNPSRTGSAFSSPSPGSACSPIQCSWICSNPRCQGCYKNGNSIQPTKPPSFLQGSKLQYVLIDELVMN